MSILHFPVSEFRALAYIPRGSDQYATALKTMPNTTRPTISGCRRRGGATDAVVRLVVRGLRFTMKRSVYPSFQLRTVPGI